MRSYPRETRYRFWRAVVVSGTLAAALVAPGSARADNYCAVAGQPLLNTANNCNGVPDIDRAIMLRSFTWKGHRYLIADVGNDLRLWQVDNPTAPGSAVSSHFRVPLHTDIDQNLVTFAVCDDCRYGIAAFGIEGQVLFDLGTGSTPSLSTSHQIAEYAAGTTSWKYVATFKTDDGAQYVIGRGVDVSCSGDNGVARIAGVNTSDLTGVGCLEADGVAVKPLRTWEVRGSNQNRYLYILTATETLELFRIVTSVGGSMPLQWIGTVATGLGDGQASVDIDTGNLMLAVQTTSGMNLYQLQDPDGGNPTGKTALVTGYDPPSGIGYPSVLGAIQYPFVWIAKRGGQDAALIDIANPSNPQEIEPGFWDPTNPWNDYSPDGCQHDVFGHFVSSGTSTVLFLAQFSILQGIDVSACGSAEPTARLEITPGEVFPGDTITVRNISTGSWTRSALWIEDEAGTVVAGHQSLQVPNDPDNDTVTFQVPLALASTASYTAHVIVESDDYPWDPGHPAGQTTSEAVAIDRAPEAQITITPQAVITGDTVTLHATAEGHPAAPEVRLDPFSWTLTPPAGAGCPTGWTVQDSMTCTAEGQDPPAVLLSTSGPWECDLVVSYVHEATGGTDLYTATVHEALDVTSVAAALSVPDNPLNTDSITLNGTASRWDASVDSIGYQWEVLDTLGNSAYGGCGSGSVSSASQLTCTIPEDTLDPGNYTVRLTITNGSDTSSVERTLSVADGSVQVSFNCIPSVLDIGAETRCTVSGITDMTIASQVRWNWGGAGCDEGSTETCVPDSAIACTTARHSYSSAGTKTITLTVTVGGTPHTATGQVTVNASGSCSGGGGDGGGGGGGGGGETNDPDFSWIPGSPQIGQDVRFTISGIAGTLEQVTWDFGGPGCSEDQQVTCTNDGWTNCSMHTFQYSSSGAKTVHLTVRIDGQNYTAPTHTLTVQDAGECGQSCSYTVSPMMVTMKASGGTSDITVSADDGCDWTATANAGWLHIVSGSSGSGDGTVTVRADANSGDARQGSLTVAGRNVTIKQDAASGGGGGGDETGPMLVPAAASVPGVGGTNWKSDLRIFNPAEDATQVQIQYIPEPGDTTAYPTLLYTVNPDNTIWIDDIMYWFTQGAQAKGALVITYTPEDARPLIVSRTYNDTDAGTYGQLVPVLGSSSLASAGERLVVTGVEHNDDFRTNIGLVNTGNTDAGVVIRLLSDTGETAQEITYTIPAMAYIQRALSNLAQDPELEFNGTVVVEVVTGGPVAVYGSIVDQRTGDPIFVQASKK